MKSIVIFVIIFLMSGKCFSQFYPEIGIGYSALHHATGELALGYHFHPFIIQGGYIAHVSRDVEAGAVINLRGGLRLNLSDDGGFILEPTAGYAYNLRSNDRKELNTRSVIGSVYAGKRINDGTLLVGINYTERIWTASVVMRCNL